MNEKIKISKIIDDLPKKELIDFIIQQMELSFDAGVGKGIDDVNKFNKILKGDYYTKSIEKNFDDWFKENYE